MQLIRALTWGLGLLFATSVGAGESFKWEVPGALQQVEVPGLLEFEGIPMRIQAVKSSWKIDALLQHFATSFEKAGLYIPPTRHQIQMLRELQLTALDPDRLISYTVIFQESQAGTVVILGEANLGLRQRKASNAWAPIFPAATGIVSSRQEGARTLVYSINARPEEVAGFYREALGKSGFVEQDPGFFTRAGEEMMVSTHAGKSGRLTVLVVDRTREEVRPGVPPPGSK